MNINVNASPGKFTGFALVRDKDGKPKIDDYENCPEEIKAMLTPQERQFFETKRK